MTALEIIKEKLVGKIVSVITEVGIYLPAKKVIDVELDQFNHSDGLLLVYKNGGKGLIRLDYNLEVTDV